MIEFVRLVEEQVEDLLVLDVEAFRDYADEFKQHTPDSLREGEFHAVHGGILEESADGLVVGEAPGGGEQVVLQGRDGGHCHLRGEVAHLVLAQPEVLLALLEDDLQRPSHGVDLVGLEEAELGVCGDEPVPLAALAAPGEEQPHAASSEGHVNGDVVAAQPAAVAAPVLGLVEEGDELAGGVVPPLVRILRLAHLYHAEVVAADAAGSDEADDLRAGEPAVGQHVVETDLVPDDAAYHVKHQGDLAPAVLLDAQGGVGTLPVFLGETLFELLLPQAVFPVLPRLADEGEVEQHLADAVGYADEQALEAEDHRMRHVGVYPADEFGPDAPLGIVRVVHHQADRLRARGGPALLALVPELARHGGEDLAPVVRLVGDETVKHVLAAAEQAA